MLSMHRLGALVALAALSAVAVPSYAATISHSGTVSTVNGGSARDNTFHAAPIWLPAVGDFTVSGTVDLTGMTNGTTVMIGLLGAGENINSHGLNPTDRGAWAYITRLSNGNFRFGPSKGNNGGEIISTFTTVPSTTTSLDFSLVINATTVAFSAGAFTPAPINHLSNFSNGAYFTVDAFRNAGAAYSVSYDLTLDGAAVPTPAAATAGFSLLGGLALRRSRRTQM